MSFFYRVVPMFLCRYASVGEYPIKATIGIVCFSPLSSPNPMVTIWDGEGGRVQGGGGGRRVGGGPVREADAVQPYGFIMVLIIYMRSLRSVENVII